MDIIGTFFTAPAKRTNVLDVPQDGSVVMVLPGSGRLIIVAKIEHTPNHNPANTSKGYATVTGWDFANNEQAKRTFPADYQVPVSSLPVPELALAA